MSLLKNPIFQDQAKAREWLERQLWPDGPICPHCGLIGCSYQFKGRAHRPGVYKCKGCEKQFTVTVGTIFERSHLPLNTWLLAFHLMVASKKGVSAHQIHRMLGITYKTAWFVCHRIREAMCENKLGAMLGGANKVVEVDESYVGGKAKNRATREVAPKKPVLSLVEREGRVASFHVANVTAQTLRPIIVANADKASALMTDESPVYPKIAKGFATHGTVNHSLNEYARLGGFMHVNTAENFFSILKRGITGVYHSVSEAHLHRYLSEFDFRYNNRAMFGVSDDSRMARAIRGAPGKRLTYRRTGRSEASETETPF